MTLKQLLEKAKELAGRADRHVCDLASGKVRWEMRIPAEKGDSDILLSDAIRLVPMLVEICEKLQEEFHCYGEHHNSCAVWDADAGNPEECTCGLSSVLSDCDAIAKKWEG